MTAPAAVPTPGLRACAKWPDLHHPIGAGKPAVLQALEAIEVCIECPLMQACRAEADQRWPGDEIAGGWDYNAERRHATDVLLTKLADAEKAAAVQAAARAAHPQRAKVAPCGTPAGYKRHNRHKEPACDPCRAAHNRVTASYGKHRRGETDDISHGTEGGYATHRRRSEKPCTACRTANAAAAQNRRERLAEIAS
jgi:hypothetical protein